MKFFATLVACLIFCSLSYGQLEKNIHRTFRIDSVDVLSLNFSADSISIEKWAGNMILAQTNIKLYDAGSKSVLKYFVEKGRYDLELSDVESANAELASVDLKRSPIITSRDTNKPACREIVTLKLLIPEEFILNDTKTEMVREKKEEEIKEPKEDELKPKGLVEKVDN